MVDEAHGAGVLGARGAGTAELFGVEDRVDLRMGTFSKSLASCGGFIAGAHEVIDFLRIQSRAFLFTAAAVPAAVGAALAALRIVRSDEGPQLFARVLDNAALPATAACTSSASRSSSRSRCRAARRWSRRSSRCVVGDDWKAVLLWRALYDAGVFVNVALHPAVPPGGALLRTSVMATHDRADARPRAGALRGREGGLRGRARAAAVLTPVSGGSSGSRRRTGSASDPCTQASQIARCLRMIRRGRR